MDPTEVGEVKKAIQRLRNGKAAGIDQIQPEVLKYSTAIISKLTNLCNDIWQSKTVPSD